MKYFWLLFSLVVSFSCFGQSAYFVDPNWQHFYVFNENQLHKTEFLPIVQADYGEDYVAYIRNNNRFIIFTEGKLFDTQLSNPRFFARDRILAYFVDEQLWVLRNGKPQLLEKWVS
ncbi:MAG: hypothetical protein ACI9AB_000062, partial [Urechidicola sp.]